MNKYRYLFGLIIFSLFIPQVYAFDYDLVTSVVDDTVTIGTEKEIAVNIDKISGTKNGIYGCTMNIEFSNDILLNSKIRTVDTWTMTTGEIYLFDRSNPVLENTGMFIIPVKINGNGIIKISDIECNDGEIIEKIDDKVINFTVKIDDGKPNSGKDNNSAGNKEDESSDNKNDDVEKLDSNCDLSDILLSEGIIEFDSNVTDYYIEVSKISNLEINPVLESNKATYNIIKDDNKIDIEVVAEDGTNKIYTINVNELESDEEEKFDFVPIFIAIICILVVINIVRIVVNLVKNKKNRE